ncbi:MAG: sensor histidine kinase, partial [Gemmatimonadota bacterium]
MSKSNWTTRDFGDSLADAFQQLLEEAPAAFALTRGPTHAVISANRAFLDLVKGDGEVKPGATVADLFDRETLTGLSGLLDRAWHEQLIFRDQLVGGGSEQEIATRSCTVWPLLNADERPTGLIIELREAARSEHSLAVQRGIAERMLLGALREQETADRAETSQQRALFLAESGRVLTNSIDEATTREAITRLALPHQAHWCIVDLMEEDGAMRRLAIIHPDPEKQILARELANRWSPGASDAFGLPAVLRTAESVQIAEDVDQAIAAGAHSPENLRILLELEPGPLLSVPMVSRGRLLGAITFVGARHGQRYAQEDVALAQDLALRSAVALDNARLHGEAVELRGMAERASQVKSDFLAHMSHELRTPLNAIGGYVDIIDQEIHGPVTQAQHSDVDRIRLCLEHLLLMINDMLSFMQIQHGGLHYRIAEVPVRAAVEEALALIEPLADKKGV